MKPSLILAADVGASHLRMRLSAVSASRVETLVETKMASLDADGIKRRISSFVAQHLPAGSPPPRVAILGLPGKISADRRSCAISFLDPDRYVSFQDLFDQLAVEAGILLNDLECGILGIPDELDPRMRLLCGERLEPGDRDKGLVLGMPGSGLGIGLGLGAADSRPSEGGHLLAALDLGDELERRVARSVVAGAAEGSRPRMPTYEDLVRGSAIPRIFTTVVEARGGIGELEAAARALESRPLLEQPHAVETWACSSESPFHVHARATFSLYGRFLGRVMQAQALTLLPGAVYLGGGVVVATYPLFAKTFAESFQHHRIHDGFLRRLPVYVVENPDLNLDGATRKARETLARLAAPSGPVGARPRRS